MWLYCAGSSPGTSVRTTWLCRDKPSMKEALRQAGVPTAASAAVDSAAEARAFAEREGYPLILKPRAGAGAQGTVQQKTASARVQSPGNLEPFGLSLNCLLTVANNLPGSLGTTVSDVLPLNYFAPGPLTKDTTQAKWKTSLSTSNGLVPVR